MPAEILETILDAVGNTPLVRLSRLASETRTQVVAKVESLNPGGSIKDRIGLAMIEAAEHAGQLHPGATIVEPTSGNTGTGLAIAAALKGYRLVCVMPDKMSSEKIALLRAYGADVVVCPTAVPRESPQSYYSVADRLAREIPGAFQPNQYFNPANTAAHEATTGPEIWRQTDGQITHFVAGMGTGGTISGVAKFLKEKKPSVHIVGADPEGSLYSGPIAPYKVEGVGEDFMPGTMNIGIVDQIVQVTDKQSFVAARRLAREEGILVGGSSGMALHAALEVARDRGPDEVIVVLFPDTGRNYLSKFFSDEWMRQNGFMARLGAVRIREVLAEHAQGMPPLVTVESGRTVGEAIDIMQRYGISQLPVTDESNGQGVIGTLQERTLLDRVYRDPSVVTTAVSAAMDAPLSQVGVDSSIDDAFEPLLRGEQALLVVDGGKPVAVVTRADLLEFVAHRGK